MGYKLSHLNDFRPQMLDAALHPLYISCYCAFQIISLTTFKKEHLPDADLTVRSNGSMTSETRFADAPVVCTPSKQPDYWRPPGNKKKTTTLGARRQRNRALAHSAHLKYSHIATCETSELT